MSRRGRLRGAAALVVLASLTGCAALPTSGPVVAGQAVGDGADLPAQFVPRGPADGATPDQIVRGFLDAAGQDRDERTVARSYLTPAQRTNWRPDASVVVYPSQSSVKLAVLSGGQFVPPSATATASATASRASATASHSPSPRHSPSPSATAAPAPSASVTATPTATWESAPVQDGDRAVVSVTVPVSAVVDGNGVYQPAEPGAHVNRVFSLQVVSGQWRIDGLDAGLLVTESDFGLYFRDVALYFPDPTGRYLVPDVRFFEVGTPATPTVVTKALLAGPVGWLASAVTTGAPAGTSMPVESVPVAGGVATVDLDQTALSADSVHRQMLQAQLRQTLTRLPGSGIVSVEVTVAGVQLGGAPAATGAARAVTPALQVDPTAPDVAVLVDDRGRLTEVIDGEQRVVPGLSDLDAAAAVGAPRGVHELEVPAVSLDLSTYAALAAGRTRLLLSSSNGPVSVVATAARLVPPTFDPQGWVWTSPVAATGELTVSRTEHGVQQVQAPWLTGVQLVSLRVSHDGTRLLVVGLRNGQPFVGIGGIVRAADGQPTSVVSPLSLLPGATAVGPGVWLDDMRVVVLAAVDGQGLQPVVAQVGGPWRGTVTVKAADAVAASSTGTLWLGTADGTVLTRVGASWVSAGKQLHGRWPTYPG